jgi:hypothetical protein
MLVLETLAFKKMAATCSEAGQRKNVQGQRYLKDTEAPYCFLISSAVTFKDVLSLNLVTKFIWELLELSSSAELWSTQLIHIRFFLEDGKIKVMMVIKFTLLPGFL